MVNYGLGIWGARLVLSPVLYDCPQSPLELYKVLHPIRSGFIIAVTTIDSIGLGALQPGRGFALYPIKYKVQSLSAQHAWNVVMVCMVRADWLLFVSHRLWCSGR